MKMGYFIGNWNTYYVVDEKNRSLAKKELSGSVKDCVQKIQDLKKGIASSEIITLLNKALKAVDRVAVENEVLAHNLQGVIGQEVVFFEGDIFRRLRLMFFRKGIGKRHPLAVALAIAEKRNADAEPDAVIHRLVSMLTTYDKSYHFYENLKERWYENRVLDENESGIIAKEEEVMQEINQLLIVISEARKKTKKTLASICRAHAPNLCQVAGSLIAAKLIAEAGSLTQLSIMSAGTIQLLGARKAFSRAQNLGSPLPKYGIIYAHPFIQKVPSQCRGKMARFLSCQIAIASRADHFTQKDIGVYLKSRLRKRARELRMES